MSSDILVNLCTYNLERYKRALRSVEAQRFCISESIDQQTDENRSKQIEKLRSLIIQAEADLLQAAADAR